MKRSYIGLALGVLVAVGAALSLPSCGHDQKLVSLTITPTTFTFLTPYPSGTEQYTAAATYIHPPATKDVTSQATWKIDDGVVTMSSPGLFTPAPPPQGSPPGTPGPCGGGISRQVFLRVRAVRQYRDRGCDRHGGRSKQHPLSGRRQACDISRRGRRSWDSDESSHCDQLLGNWGDVRCDL